MDTRHHELIGPLHHGTRSQAATAILREGFGRGRSRSYTGTGVCLSETLSVAYEYGMYETGGCVLQTWLSPTARWVDRSDCIASERSVEYDTWDDFFEASGLDAVRAYGGNVWVVWNPRALTLVRGLSHREAIQGLCAQFDSDGPDHGYNGVVSDYAASGGAARPKTPTSGAFPSIGRSWSKPCSALSGARGPLNSAGRAL